MGLTDKIGIAILCAFVLFSVVRLFAAPYSYSDTPFFMLRSVIFP